MVVNDRDSQLEMESLLNTGLLNGKNYFNNDECDDGMGSKNKTYQLLICVKEACEAV